MIDMNTFADISEKFLGPNSLLNDMRGRFPAATDEVTLSMPGYYIISTV